MERFPTAGYRRWQDGTSIYFGSYGDYWASTPVSASEEPYAPEYEEGGENESPSNSSTDTYVHFMTFDRWPNSGTTHLCPHAYGSRSFGYSVRCVAE